MIDISSDLLNVDEITFPNGLIGIPEWNHFSLRQTIDMLPIALLYCKDAGDLSLIVANPGTWYPEYSFEISDEDMATLKAESVDNLITLVIINVDADPFLITSNLVSPILINPEKNLGVQIMLHKSPYQARQPLTVKSMTVTIEEGLAGIPEYKNFALQFVDELIPITLLVCQDQNRISFPVIDPLLINPEYSPKLSKEDLEALKVSNEKDVSWFVILNVENDPLQITANLMAPLVINPENGIGRQVILSKSGYHTMHPIKTMEINKK